MFIKYPDFTKTYLSRAENKLEKQSNTWQEIMTIYEFVPIARMIMALYDVYVCVCVIRRQFWLFVALQTAAAVGALPITAACCYGTVTACDALHPLRSPSQAGPRPGVPSWSLGLHPRREAGGWTTMVRCWDRQGGPSGCLPPWLTGFLRVWCRTPLCPQYRTDSLSPSPGS